MDSLKAMEAVVDYLEELAGGADEVDYKTVSRLAGSPAPLFQRIFVYVAGVTIAEYVRRRRLTLAAWDIRNREDIKIIDTALRYGFGSHASFTRAFKEHHKASPSDIRQGTAKPADYPRISFTNLRIVGGKRIMAELKKIEYVEYGPRKVVGTMKRTTFQKAGEECWGAAFAEGLFDRLASSEEWICKDLDPYIGLGHMSRFTGQDEFQYVIGTFMEPEAPVPDGLYAEPVPAGTVAKMWIEGDTLNDIIDCAYLLATEAIAKTGYKIDHEQFYWCDIYTYDRYCTPLEKGEKLILDYIMPVIKDKKPAPAQPS